MRPISWLHISDIHMSVRDSWSQDVVLTAMCEHIGQQRAEDTPVDFVLVTGDLACSGTPDEYELVAKFFDDLSATSDVPKKRIFCIPGNHDIDRKRQKLSFLGGRASLQDQQRIDAVLGAREDLEPLLQRQKSYRDFQGTYFADQDRTPTEDSLGYVSWLTIDDVRLAIVGLDSAWLAEGGIDDHGKLLVGERQVINACKLVQDSSDPAHVIVAMAHHPFHLLQDCDRRPVMYRIESACHFFHCGHLHEPEARMTGANGTGCLTLAAGASYVTRQWPNSYSIVTLDLLRARRRVKTIQYSAASASFSLSSSEDYRFEVSPAEICSVSDLAEAIRVYDPTLAPLAYYLAALLMDRKAELPTATTNGHTLASFAIVEKSSDSDLKRTTLDFMVFRNALRVLYKRVSLADIFAQHGAAVGRYGTILNELREADTSLKDRLDGQENDARVLANTEPLSAFSHSIRLLTDLAEAHEWELLRLQSLRHMDSADSAVRILAERMLALSLANSSETEDKRSAIGLYRSLTGARLAETSDAGNLATLLFETGNFDEAKTVVLDGIRAFPAQADYFAEIGQKIVDATGDRKFRKQIEAAISERDQSE